MTRWIYGTTQTRPVTTGSVRFALPAGGGNEMAFASPHTNANCYFKVGALDVVATTSDTLVAPGTKVIAEVAPSATHYAIIGAAAGILHIRSREGTPTALVAAGFFNDTPLTLGRVANMEGEVDQFNPAGRWFAYSGSIPATISGVWDMEDPAIDLASGGTYRVTYTVRAREIASGNLFLNDLQLITRTGSHPDLWDATGTITEISNNTINIGFINVDTTFAYTSTNHYFGVVAVSCPVGVRIEIANVTFVPYVVQSLPWNAIPDENKRTFSVNGNLMPDGDKALATPILIPPGATTVNIKLTYNGTIGGEITCSANVYATVFTSFSGFGPGSVSVPDKYYWWRPGDDVDVWIPITIHTPSSVTGAKFGIDFAVTGLHAIHPSAFFVVDPAGVNLTLPGTMPFHRDPLFLDLTAATPAVEADMETMQWSDTGYVGNASSGTPCWRSRLSHGYAQSEGNVGLYMNTDVFPAQSLNPHSLQVDSNDRPFLQLHSARFPTPVNYLGKDYYFQSVMLTTQRMPAWRHRFGVWEMQAVTPKQSGAWSALWTIGVRDSDTSGMWPPEIDMFEHFNGVYSPTIPYTQYETSSTQHVGYHGSVVRQKVVGHITRLNRMGFPADWNMWTQIHRWQCVVDPIWITHFVDGIETIQYKNMQADPNGNDNWGYSWKVQIQVSADKSNPFNDGSPDMLVYGLRYYDPAASFTMEPYTATPPYPNFKMTPDPDVIAYIGAVFAAKATMAVRFQGANFFDDFNRADGAINATGVPWTRVSGSPNRLTITAQMLSHVGVQPESFYFGPDWAVANHFVEVTIRNISADCAGHVLCRATGDVYTQNWIGWRAPLGVVQLWKAVNTVYTALPGTFTVAVDDVVRMEAVGTTITIKKNGVTMLTHTVADAALQTLTNTGFRPTGNVTSTPWLDDFRSGPL